MPCPSKLRAGSHCCDPPVTSLGDLIQPRVKGDDDDDPKDAKDGEEGVIFHKNTNLHNDNGGENEHGECKDIEDNLEDIADATNKSQAVDLKYRVMTKAVGEASVPPAKAMCKSQCR